MSEGVRFETDVEGLWGYLPGSPGLWSYSSLKDVEACPRRWVLSRARYPDVWAKNGYPDIPHPLTLLGDVIHQALEVIIDAFGVSGCTATDSSDAVGVLRELGGLSAILREAIDRKVDELQINPRISVDTIESLRRALIDQLSVATNRVQLLLSRGSLPALAIHSDGARDHGAHAGASGGGQHRRRPVGPGAHPEVDVMAEDLRLWGRIDLVTVEGSAVVITDFKTGQPDASHDDQVRLYALLWDLDRQANRERRPATALVVSYPAHDRTVLAPDHPALRVLEASVAARVADADGEIASNSPRALPGANTCAFCRVRHFCDDYWDQVVPPPASVPAQEWFDIEGTVTRQDGVKSWIVESKQGGDEVLVRSPIPSRTLPVGHRVRLLGVRRVEDPDKSEVIIAALGGASETYVLRAASS